jgi:N-acetylmuramoyl-L-alanine amidase
MQLSGKYKLLVLTMCLALMPLILPHQLISKNNDNFINEIITNNEPVKVIVIDPGHGGKDVGCQGNNLMEKQIALDLALKIGNKLKIIHPEIEVRYTRTEDMFIPLHKRVEMANDPEVDLFISLHCNALHDESAHGFETYVMGLHTSEENLEIAKRENSVIQLEDLSAYESGLDPYSTEGHIMVSMMQQNNLEKSIRLADFTQESIAELTKLRNRGVKQAGFVVLRKVVVPSILVEAGFVTNENDAKFLKSNSQKEKIANSITSGITKFINYYTHQ